LLSSDCFIASNSILEALIPNISSNSSLEFLARGIVFFIHIGSDHFFTCLGIHNVLLSETEVRTRAYQLVFSFLQTTAAVVVPEEKTKTIL
jgi:hypothetical protein